MALLLSYTLLNDHGKLRIVNKHLISESENQKVLVVASKQVSCSVPVVEGWTQYNVKARDSVVRAPDAFECSDRVGLLSEGRGSDRVTGDPENGDKTSD